MFPEPKVSFLVLDYKKPQESRLLLESLKRHVKFNHKVIYLHNGLESYPQNYLNEGLIDQLIITKDNNGLGLGTRNLFAACFSQYAIYVQNDQILGRDFGEEELEYLISFLPYRSDIPDSIPWVRSISLAGAPCGEGIYSERAHLIETSTYFEWEHEYMMPYGGAGPYDSEEWREGYIQNLYKKYNWKHHIYHSPMFVDNGVFATRQNPDGSIWCHRTDTKSLWNIVKPKEKHPTYPKFTDEEWEIALGDTGWPDSQIPNKEKDNSFMCWQNTEMGRGQEKYIYNLRCQNQKTI